MLSDAQWSRIEHLLPGKPTDKGGRAADNRLFVEAVLYTARVGNPWRDLPPVFGNWHSVYVRFARWEQYGVWDRVAQALRADLCAAGFNLRWLMRAIARLLAKGLSWASILVALTGVLSPIGATLADLHRKTLLLAAAR